MKVFLPMSTYNCKLLQKLTKMFNLFHKESAVFDNFYTHHSELSFRKVTEPENATMFYLGEIKREII